MIYVYYTSPGNKQLPTYSVYKYKYTYVIRFTGGKLTLLSTYLKSILIFYRKKKPCGKVTHAAIVNTVDI